VIELVEEGSTMPTAQMVAERAGISLRTVYHHFDDLVSLRAEALGIAWERHTANLGAIDVARPLDERVVTLVRQLCRVYEAVAPVCRAESLAADTDVTADVTRQSRMRIRQYIAETLEPETKAAGISGPVLLDALDAALTWQSWDYLRTQLGRGQANASRTFEMVVRQLLATAA
jgi:AcrR family transcriptional regulator